MSNRTASRPSARLSRSAELWASGHRLLLAVLAFALSGPRGGDRRGAGPAARTPLPWCSQSLLLLGLAGEAPWPVRDAARLRRAGSRRDPCRALLVVWLGRWPGCLDLRRSPGRRRRRRLLPASAAVVSAARPSPEPEPWVVAVAATGVAAAGWAIVLGLLLPPRLAPPIMTAVVAAGLGTDGRRGAARRTASWRRARPPRRTSAPNAARLVRRRPSRGRRHTGVGRLGVGGCHCGRYLDRLSARGHDTTLTLQQPGGS